MEVDDFELLELVNDYQERSDEPTFNTLDDIPEALVIEALDEANYIEEEVKINTKSLLKWLLELSRLRGDIRTGHLVEAKG